MQAAGNALTILGIVVTFVAYFGTNSGVSFHDLEPGLTARWIRGRTWVATKLGRTKSVTVNVGSMVAATSAISATSMVWSPIQSSDDIAVRVEKLARNLDALRSSTDDLRAIDLERVREIDLRVSDRVSALEHLMTDYQERERQVSTAAMRWEVRGLLITLVGAGLSILG